MLTWYKRAEKMKSSNAPAVAPTPLAVDLHPHFVSVESQHEYPNERACMAPSKHSGVATIEAPRRDECRVDYGACETLVRYCHVPMALGDCRE